MKRFIILFTVILIAFVGLFFFLTVLEEPALAAVSQDQGSLARQETRLGPVSAHHFARAHQHHDFVDGQFEPNATVAITVTDAHGAFKGAGNGTADSSGWMDGVYAGADIVPTDKIAVASSGGFTATMEMITITASVDLAADLVTGQMSGGIFPAWGNAEANNPSMGAGMPISITASGHFTADFSGSFDIVEGDQVWAWYIDPAGNEVGGSAFYPFLEIAANYAHEWVNGRTEPGASVTISLTDSVAALKASAVVTADGSGNFSTQCSDWSTTPDCPDIAVGDGVTVWAAGLTSSVDPIGSIDGDLDATANTVSGILNAPAYTGTLDVRCEIWVEEGPPGIDTTADANGGNFVCDFDDVGWDLGPGQDVAVMYAEPDGDQVINVLGWPWMRVNYAHEWVGGDYEAGHTFWITVSDSADSVKATAIISSAPGAGWNGDGFDTQPSHWTPGNPDIEPGDKVAFSSDDGYDNMLEVGTIKGIVNEDTDAASGTVLATWFTEALAVECHPWGAWNDGLSADVKNSLAEPDGSSSYLCNWAGEWDVQPDQDVAVMYVEPDGDRVLNVLRGEDSDLLYLPIVTKP